MYLNTQVGVPVLKEELVEKLKIEIQDAKERRQEKLWAFWHIAANQMQFIDVNKDFRKVKELYNLQGYVYNSETSKDMPELAKELGSFGARRNVYTHNTESRLDIDPLSLMIGGRMNGGGEMVIMEFSC